MSRFEKVITLFKKVITLFKQKFPYPARLRKVPANEATVRRKEQKWGRLINTSPTPLLIRTQLKVETRNKPYMYTTLRSGREK